MGELIYNPFQRRWHDIDELRDENGDIVLETDDWWPWRMVWVSDEERREFLDALLGLPCQPQDAEKEASDTSEQKVP
jgi:hypothetical protein